MGPLTELTQPHAAGTAAAPPCRRVDARQHVLIVHRRRSALHSVADAFRIESCLRWGPRLAATSVPWRAVRAQRSWAHAVAAVIARALAHLARRP